MMFKALSASFVLASTIFSMVDASTADVELGPTPPPRVQRKPLYLNDRVFRAVNKKLQTNGQKMLEVIEGVVVARNDKRCLRKAKRARLFEVLKRKLEEKLSSAIVTISYRPGRITRELVVTQYGKSAEKLQKELEKMLQTLDHTATVVVQRMVKLIGGRIANGNGRESKRRQRDQGDVVHGRTPDVLSLVKPNAVQLAVINEYCCENKGVMKPISSAALKQKLEGHWKKFMEEESSSSEGSSLNKTPPLTFLEKAAIRLGFRN